MPPAYPGIFARIARQMRPKKGIGAMQIKGSSLFSTFGVPALGLGALLLGLWHSGPAAVRPISDAASTVYLLKPDVRMDKSMTVCLRQQAKEVARCRARLHSAETAGRRLSSAEAGWRREGLTQAVEDYNLVARECTPDVFARTGMPPAM